MIFTILDFKFSKMIENEICVLLIDDDKATNFFNKMVVKRHGGFNEVKSVESGIDALIYLKSIKEDLNLKPDLIFLDINMPGMNGWEFLGEFVKLDQSITSDIKVILLSTSSDPADVERAIKKHPVTDYINKPLSFPLLNEVLSKHFSVEVDSDYSLK